MIHTVTKKIKQCTMRSIPLKQWQLRRQKSHPLWPHGLYAHLNLSKIQGLSSGRNSTTIFRRRCHQNSVCWHTAAPCHSNCSTYTFHTLFSPRADTSCLCKRKCWPVQCQTYLPRNIWLQSIEIVVAHPGCEQAWRFRPLTMLPVAKT